MNDTPDPIPPESKTPDLGAGAGSPTLKSTPVSDPASDPASESANESTPKPAPTARRLDYDLRDATAFLTQIPVGAPRHAPASQYCWAFPLVGAAIGALGGGVYLLLLAAPLPPLVAALMALGSMIFLTGALHEDGLADTADGFGGGFGAARKLEIMRDSRIGAFGVLALILSLGVRAAALIALAEFALPALIAAGALSRAAMPALMWRLPLASASGLAAAAGRPAGQVVLMGLTLGGAAALWARGPGPGLIVITATGLAAFATGALAQRQIRGYNGDVLGAAQQIGEIAALLCILVLQGRGVL